MSAAFTIAPVRSDAEAAATRELFEAYAASLPVDLAYQEFGTELAELPGQYAPPRGELLLARDPAGATLGCVALRPIAIEGCCEMKRLFLRPTARRLGVGRALAEAIVKEARRIGYRELRLDTLPTMAAALSLYAQMGFERIPPYYKPTPPGTIFMRLEL
jgi:GNAT superfamily N-acetyltransferase